MTLFAEIAGRPAPVAPSLRDEVAESLQRLCSTRHKSLLLAREYGVGDVTTLFHSFPQIDAWAAHLERAIAFYEPRLGRVEVVPIVTEPPELTLRAEIRAVLLVGGRPTAARFTAELDARSRLSVR